MPTNRIYTYIVNIGDLTDNTQFDVTFTLNMYVNNVVESRVQKCKFVALDIMLDSATLTNLNSNKELLLLVPLRLNYCGIPLPT